MPFDPASGGLEKGSAGKVEGIDRIKRHILAEAEAEVAAILAETETAIDQELARAGQECEHILSQAGREAEQEAELVIKRGQGIADALKRRQALEHRQALADRVIRTALELLAQRPASVKAELYASWIRGLGLDQGVITLAASEKDQLADQMLKALPEGRFSLSDQAGDFSGGLIVTHDRIRDNLTYDMVVRDYRPQLARAVLTQLGLDGEGEGQDG